ncbi:MAG: T9SS type A sorting domain-containing protein [Chitinophagaceae bacterium]|nr:T9SS type A sorting domain-containing protein [Chitinophagaceae bacterium]
MKNLYLFILSFLFFNSTNAQTFNLVKNVNLSPDNGYVSINCSFKELNGKLYYIFPEQASSKNTLYETDGTNVGTNRITPANVNITSNLIVGGNKIYFFASDGLNGVEPWVSDGTTAGTFMLKNINASTDDNFAETMFLTFLSADSSKAFFKGNDGTTGEELWVTDGTTLGTVFVADIFQGINGSQIKISKSAHGSSMRDGKLYFFAVNGNGGPTTLNGEEPWVSDGTQAGTFLLKDIVPGYQGCNTSFGLPIQIIEYNNKMYFMAVGQTAASQTGLYETDGTTAGTIQAFTTSTSSFDRINEMIVFNNKIYYTVSDGGSDPRVFSTDGTLAGITFIDTLVDADLNNPATCQMTIANNELYFRVNHNTLGDELYKLDASNKINLVKEICVGASFGINSNVYSERKVFQVYDNKLWFLGSDGSAFGAQQMWRSDGTVAGTIAMSPLNNDSGWAGGYLSPYDIYATSFGMFMIYTNPTTGSELYVYNNSTSSIEEINVKNKISIYPNPTTDFIEIISETPLKHFLISTILGRKIMNSEITNNKINISNLPSGTYYLNVTDENMNSVTKQFIKL